MDHLAQMAEKHPPATRPNLAREYLQLYLLRLLHEIGAFSDTAFVGGTALRVLHDLPRFSEDLDFSTRGSGEFVSDGDWQTRFRKLKVALESAGYPLTVKTKPQSVISSAFFRFDGLPHTLGWAEDPRLGLSIKLEIDLNPPPGGRSETTLVQRFFPIALRHHDLPSLFSGKLHALLARPYPKGRDWFDLVWYLTEMKSTQPNLPMLENALRQTGHDPALAAGWRKEVADRLRSLDWTAIEADMRPFLQRPSDLAQLNVELIEGLLVG